MTISTFCWTQVQLTQPGEIPRFTAAHLTRPKQELPLKGRYYADVITPDPDIDNASELERAEAALINHQPVRIASIDLLVRLKTTPRATQRPKDLRDVELLKRARR
jgi:hypothetical protein